MNITKEKIYNFTPLLLILSILIISYQINPEILSRYLVQSKNMNYLDLGWYVRMAQENGFLCHAFYPLWPKLISIFQRIFDFNYYQSGIFLSTIIAFISFILGNITLKKLTKDSKEFNLIWLLSLISPAIFYLFMGYTEAIFSVESWCLIICSLNILNSDKKQKTNIQINSFIIILISILIGTTRPAIVQMVFSSIGALLIIYLSSLQKINQNNFIVKKSLIITISMIIGVTIGYLIVGKICLLEGKSFFYPFQIQSEWNKSLGLRLKHLIHTSSPFLDVCGLYYPLIIIFGRIPDIVPNNLKRLKFYLNQLRHSIYKFLPISLIFLPAGFLVGTIYTLISNRKNKKELYIEKDLNYKIENTDFIFWFCALFAFSHSLICFLTQPNYMIALGRYIFAQPYFYIATTILICSKNKILITYPKIIFLVSVIISYIYLMQNIINFGYGKIPI